MELHEDKAGEFRFRLEASKGETISASEGYKFLDFWCCTHALRVTRPVR